MYIWDIYGIYNDIYVYIYRCVCVCIYILAYYLEYKLINIVQYVLKQITQKKENYIKLIFFIMIAI